MRLPVLFAAAVLAGALATAASAKVVVSSKIDTEGGVLGNVIALALKANGVEVEDRIQLGGTPVVRKAITAGEIDIYPEYTGNAAFFFNKADDPVWKDAAKGYEEAKKLDYDANKIVWLTPSPANNTWAIALRKEVAASAKLTTLSDFGKWVSGGGKVKLAASAEFVNSAAALPAFQTAYGFKLSPDQLIVLSGGDTAATIKAAAEQTNGANAAMVYGTDGAIQPSGLVVLDDDKGVQPVYRPTPIIREAALKANPKIADILKPIFEALDLATLQALNARVQVRWRARQGGRRGLPQVEGLLEVSDCRRGGSLAPAARRSEVPMAASVARTARIASLGFDKLGVVVAALLAVGAASPFAVFRANRIVAGEAKPFFEALPPPAAALFALARVRRRRASRSRGRPRARGSRRRSRSPSPWRR